MGKKSVMDAPLLPSPEDQAVDALEVSLPAEQTALGELFQEFLRVALQTQEDTQQRRSKNQVKTTFSQPKFYINFQKWSFFIFGSISSTLFQEADLLMKILENYIQNRK